MSADGVASRAVVLFDFDGVLVRGDSSAQFLQARLRGSPWRCALALLAAPIALPLVLTHRGLPLGARIFGKIARLGTSDADYIAQVDAFAQRIARDPAHIIHAGMTALRQAQASGARVAVVSGSHESLIRCVLDAQGIAGVEIVASRLRPRRHCIGARKLEALAQIGIVPPWDVAYTDSIMDLPMLRHARRAVLVNAPSRVFGEVALRLGREPETVQWS